MIGHALSRLDQWVPVPPALMLCVLVLVLGFVALVVVQYVHALRYPVREAWHGVMDLERAYRHDVRSTDASVRERMASRERVPDRVPRGWSR
ncbi:MAG: hypothetical protein U0Y82_16805 [Thermoleophilia bacterium]